jgi:hypothetical protein
VSRFFDAMRLGKAATDNSIEHLLPPQFVGFESTVPGYPGFVRRYIQDLPGHISGICR